MPERPKNPRWRAERNFRAKVCGICDAGFAPNTASQKYCSPACAEEAEWHDKACQECGEAFRTRSARGKFCSPRCAGIATARNRNPQVKAAEYPQPAVCEGCKMKYMKKSRYVRYCSAGCSATHRAELRRLGAEPKPRVRWGCKAKGESACRNCGRPAVHLHHIVPRSKSRAGKDNITGNGAPLCNDCHTGWHYRTVTLHHHILTDEEFGFMVVEGGGLWGEHNYPGKPAPPGLHFETFAERVRRVVYPDECPFDCLCRKHVVVPDAA